MRTPAGAGRHAKAAIIVPGSGTYGMEAVAQRLHTTSRTLRRRLEDEGTTFQAVLNEVRANLAKEYLATTRLSSDDIAVALGFSDTASFRAAFRKWTQHTPAEYRRAARSAAWAGRSHAAVLLRRLRLAAVAGGGALVAFTTFSVGLRRVGVVAGAAAGAGAGAASVCGSGKACSATIARCIWSASSFTSGNARRQAIRPKHSWPR